MNRKRAKEIIDQFADKKILVVGDVMLDRYVFGKVERLNPEAPVPILHVQEEKYATGGAGNTAKNVAALGGKAALVGVVGKDDIAQRLEKAAREEGYEARLVKDRTRPTTEKIRYLVHSQQMLRVDYEKIKDVVDSTQQAVREKIEESAQEADAIIVSDYAKGVITQEIARAILKTGRPIMADVKPSRAGWFSGVAWLSPNRKEAHEFLGLDQFDNGGISDAELARKLKEKFDSKIFLTLSASGIYVMGDKEAHVPQDHTVEVADTSGAGDTVAVVLVLAKLAGATDVEAAQLANAAGAVVVSKVGAVGVNQEELLNMITHTHD